MKYCSRCRQFKEVTHFYPNRTKQDGLSSWCQVCTLDLRRSDRPKEKHRRWLRKLEVIAAYGGKCRCCGEAEPKFLSIDHIYNDGAIERQGIQRSQFYDWLKRNGYPKDRYQLLCMNCNFAKGKWGSCPHLEKSLNIQTQA